MSFQQPVTIDTKNNRTIYHPVFTEKKVSIVGNIKIINVSSYYYKHYDSATKLEYLEVDSEHSITKDTPISIFVNGVRASIVYSELDTFNFSKVVGGFNNMLPRNTSKYGGFGLAGYNMIKDVDSSAQYLVINTLSYDDTSYCVQYTVYEQVKKLKKIKEKI